MDYSALTSIGLTEGEVKVYLALLSLGTSTSGPIIEKASVSRSIIYNILDRLIEKGLVSFVLKDKTKFYQAANPSQLEHYLDEQETQFNKNRKKISELIPKLEEQKVHSKESIAQIYQGFKGVQSAHEHSYLKLKPGEEYFYLGILAEQTEGFHIYWRKDHKRRVQTGINCRLLFNKETNSDILKNRNSYKGCEARYLQDDIETPAWFMGYKDTTVIGVGANTKNPIAIEIVNQDVADSFKSYFDEFWKRSKSFKDTL